MKILDVKKIYLSLIVVIFIGVIVHAPVSVFLGTKLPHLTLTIKAWKEILMLLAIPMAFYLMVKRKLAKDIIQNRIFQLVSAYLFLHLFSLLINFQGIKPTLAGLAIDLRYIIYFFLVYIAIKIMPESRKILIAIGMVGACIVSLFAFMQLFLPKDILSNIGYSDLTIMPYMLVDQNPNYIRINSTLRGPNPLGAYSSIVLITALAYLSERNKKKTDRARYVRAGVVVLGLLALLALWNSYSRSALLGAIFGTILLGAVFLQRTKLFQRKKTEIIIAIGAAFVIAFASSFFINRINQFIANVIFHEKDVGVQQTTSNSEHLVSFSQGASNLIAHPLGTGVGSVGSASLLGGNSKIVENQYFHVASESGWVGLTVFLLINILILIKLWQSRREWLCLGLFASGISLCVIGLVLPVWVDDTVSIVWWGMVAIALAGGYANGKKEAGNKKTERIA